MAGTTAVVVGAGGIGRALIEMLAPLDVRIIAINRSGRTVAGAGRTETAAALTKVLPEADWVVVTAASTAETRHVFDKTALAAMKPDAWIVNVARGALIDTDALVEVLASGSIGGAALDVTDPEPLPEDHPLWRFDNVLITPHVANTWDMAVPDLVALIERNVRSFAADGPLEGLVDPALGY
jgi:phosphoglycerate dehydrogenase-like enzyme